MASPSGTLRGMRGHDRLLRRPVSALWRVVLAPAAILLGLMATQAGALSFGPNDAFTLRGKAYAMYTIATEDSQEYSNGTGLDPGGAIPERNAGDMIQQRNFMNPEFEVDFRRLVTPTRSWFDDLSGRLALWGFYDGIYDYGPERWSQVLRQYNRHELQSVTQGSQTQSTPVGAPTKGPLSGNVLERDARDVYGRRIRVNEAYMNFAKGPFFLRIGRQAISWGEADTIGLLDANNPFDITIQPGLFLDLDEARIPLWTIRGTYELFDVMGPISSAFLEAYWVPGWLDTTISPLVIQSASPYAVPPPASLGFSAPPDVAGQRLQIFQETPEPSTANSRWGVKLQGVLFRDYNLQTWFYTTFPIQPVPTLQGIDVNGQITTALNNKLTNVIGVASSSYSDMLNSIVRAEVELFNGEPGFLAYKNIGQVVASGFATGVTGHYDRLNIVRGELGLDHNIFVPMLNPTSSFLIVSSIVWFWNTNESDTKDYRANGILKPSAIERGQRGGAPAGTFNGIYCDNPNDPNIPEGQRQCDFVNEDPFSAFAQATIRTDMMHGTLTPQMTTIATSRGALTFAPGVTYRFTDNFLFDVKYVNTHTFGSINNGFTIGVGLNRDRDQLWFRATYQLN